MAGVEFAVSELDKRGAIGPDTMGGYTKSFVVGAE